MEYNRYRPPFFEVPLYDKDETVLQVTPPTVDLQEELRAHSAELHALLGGGTEEQRQAFWDLGARLMSCNRNMRTFTPEDLRKTYRLVEDDLVAFFYNFVEFVTNIENAKN